MTTAVRPHARSAAARTTTDEARPADVLVVFGITGDLAKQMTFRSLYRLECRGLLDCPIVGVAVDDWTVADLRERARTSIEATGETVDGELFDRFAARLSYISGDFGDAETFERLAAAIHDAHTPVFYLEIPPFLFGSVVKGLSDAGLTHGRARRRREALRPRPRVGPRAGRRDAPVHRRVPAVPHRPLPREDGRGGDPLPALRQRGLEPIWTASTSPRSRSRWPRASASRIAATSTTRSARCATSSSTTSCRWSPPRRWRCRPTTTRRAQGRAAHAVQRDPAGRPRPLRARPVRRLPRHRRASPPTRPPRPTRRCAWTSTTGAGRACRSSSAPGKRMPVTQTELRLVFQRPPRVGFHAVRVARARADAARGQARPGHRRAAARRGPARPRGRARADQPRHGVRRRGRRGPDALRGAARAPPCAATATRFTRQDGVEEAWRIMQPLLDAPPPVHPYAKGSWGPAEADRLLAGDGRWHEPWVAS